MVATMTFVTLAGCMAAPPPEPKHPERLAQMLPSELHGWKPNQADGVYDAHNLYDYIDGAAEVYRSFNVRWVRARRYAKPGEEDLIADLFDMGTPQDAFGAYHHDMREGIDPGLGQESEQTEGALAFWKDHYFVSLLALDETDDARSALLALGRAIADTIPENGAPPALLRFLPKAGLVTSQVHYFHDHLCLNLHYFLADENLLKLDPSTEGLLARYAWDKPGQPKAQGCVLVLAKYTNAHHARQAHHRFMHVYLPDAHANGIARTEDGRWAGARLNKELFVGVFDAPTNRDVERMFGQVDRAAVRATRPAPSKGDPDHEPQD